MPTRAGPWFIVSPCKEEGNGVRKETGSGLHLAIIGVTMWGAENSRGLAHCRKGSA